jgi:hypothetical protein
MIDDLVLGELPDESLDVVLGMTLAQKAAYFSSIVAKYYTKIDKDSPEFEELIATYVSSYYVEKLYRANRFFNEKFTPVYSNTGLIRNIIADMYYADDDLITH